MIEEFSQLSEKDFLIVLIENAKDELQMFQERKCRAIKDREKLPLEHQPVDGAYWYQQEMKIHNKIHRLRQNLANLED